MIKIERKDDGNIRELSYFGVFWQDGKLFTEEYTADLDGYGGTSEMKDVSDQYKIISDTKTIKQDLLDILENTENIQKLKLDLKCYLKGM